MIASSIEDLHEPGITDQGNGVWLTYCIGCSAAAHQWVSPCDYQPSYWPPHALYEEGYR